MEQFKQFEKQYITFNGFLAKDPELKYFENGKVVCRFTMPLKKSKDDEALWLNCETWNNTLAETIAEKYKKGNELTVIGYLKEDSYKDKNGDDKKAIKFIVKIAM